jgi:hypothetical protein
MTVDYVDHFQCPRRWPLPASRRSSAPRTRLSAAQCDGYPAFDAVEFADLKAGPASAVASAGPPNCVPGPRF